MKNGYDSDDEKKKIEESKKRVEKEVAPVKTMRKEFKPSPAQINEDSRQSLPSSVPTNKQKEVTLLPNSMQISSVVFWKVNQDR